jgi:hypothetical protein
MYASPGPQTPSRTPPEAGVPSPPPSSSVRPPTSPGSATTTPTPATPAPSSVTSGGPRRWVERCWPTTRQARRSETPNRSRSIFTALRLRFGVSQSSGHARGHRP